MKTTLAFRAYSLAAGVLFSLALTVHSGASFPISTPEQQGVSSSAILSLIEQLEEDVDAVHSIMIVRHGHLITQGWWAPYEKETPHLMHSLSKSFTSTAIGLAIAEGELSLDDQVMSFFPDDIPEEPSWQLKAMRIRDLITMNTGHRREPRLFNVESNWVRTFLHSEIEFKPGTHFQYNSAATYMLSAILQKVTGERLVDYLDTRLFQPLGIKKPEWDESPDGVNTGGWGLRITTETIAKLGQLYLQKGVWQGKRILSEQWVHDATTKQTSNGSNPENDWDQGYGYQFWRCRHNCYRGDGAFGQFCIVIPEQDTVVAITSGANNMGGIMSAIWETLLPALKADALPANDYSSQALSKRLKSLGLRPPSGESDSKISRQIAQKTFRFQENEAGVKSVSFHLHKTEHRITAEMKHGTEILRIGHAEYIPSNIKQHLPYAQDMRRSIGAAGGWIEPNVYQAKIYFCETPGSITYTFRFEDDRVTWESELRHSLFGQRNIAPLVSE